MDAVLQQSQRRTVQAFLRSYGNQGIAHRASHDSWMEKEEARAQPFREGKHVS
jgi:hypothetical protein